MPSKLTPYQEEIFEMRRQNPPVPYREIAKHLEATYGISCSHRAVYSFVAVRANPRKLKVVPPPREPSEPGEVKTPPNTQISQPVISPKEPTASPFTADDFKLNTVDDIIRKRTKRTPET